MQVEYVSWARFVLLCGILYRRIQASGFSPDLIIAITRGGYPPARLLSDYFGISDLLSLKVEHYRGPDKLRSAIVPYPFPASIESRRVLVVDDVSDSGDSLVAALRQLEHNGAPRQLRTAVLHHKETSSLRPDYFAQRIVKWRWITYPWAVVEDLSGLIPRLERSPGSIEELKQQLWEGYRLKLPAQILAEVAPIVLADRQG
jgi:hypoxanthine phosphoribosyltransferase